MGRSPWLTCGADALNERESSTTLTNLFFIDRSGILGSGV